ncbi:RNA-binding region-containing protein 3 isoform X2 [Neodiprion lecontei]|uniref:RNA-binding region-containing protein 3 n=1 Tax=Neodiprion lecontei TaxID=441921 RepID=A0A6J0B9Y2_NEOLC|nr:RNA-binding region-containing protein 3 isoform X2 [Neodiprion lecontei]
MESTPYQDEKFSCDTLRISHLPSNLTNSQRESLLQKFGAIKVKTINKSEKYAITFAKFVSKHAATQALFRLHQLQVRGQRLSVEFAKKSISDFSVHESHNLQSSKDEGTKEESTESNFQTFLNKLNGWAFSQVLTQPPSPNIWYKYSPPTANTLLRIAIQMIKEPVFYCQVLHLMNKMNLPPPFQELESEFPFLKDCYDVERYRDIFGPTVGRNRKNDDETEESDESELETDENMELKAKEIIPIKRKRAQSSKRLKIPKFVNPLKQALNTSSANQKVVKPEDVFESLQRSESKSLKIALKVDSDLEKRLDMGNEINPITGSPVITSEGKGGFGLIYPVKKPDDPGAKDEDAPVSSSAEFITLEELVANRISVNDQRLLPVFKNYHPGKPSCRLYIKNLSKQVELKDLDYIYKKYVLPYNQANEEAPRYNVRLMQEGRMKGQAFITLQTIEQARIALEETNGFILKNKPMVVQFAKIVNKPQTS